MNTFLLWCIKKGIYNRVVKCLANTVNIRTDAISILAGGNTQYPSRVIELAREAIAKEGE